MDQSVSALVRECDVCSRHDEHVKRAKPPLQPIPLPEKPWQRLMIDVIGPMKGPQSEQYGIVLCDLYSRWPEVALGSDATAGTIVSFLERVFAREGAPEELISDNGPAFRSAQLGEFLRCHGVRQTFSSPYSPQTCGLVERMNRTIKGACQSARLAGKPRAAFLREFLQNYRTTPHPATGVSPFLLMRGREAKTRVDVLPPPFPDRGRASVDRRVRRRHRRYQAGYKERYDRSATAPPAWAKGDWVRLRKPGTGRVEGQPSVQVQRRTGPVSFKLETGERAHARRLVAGKPGQVSGGDLDTELVCPSPAVPETASPVPATPGPVPPVELPAAAEPGATQPRRRFTVASPVTLPRRSGRVSKPADRFSPSRY